MKPLQISISVCIVLISLTAAFNLVNKPSSEVQTLVEDILALYGEAIYQRESCINCHTIVTDKSNSATISLDGQGGLRNSNWYYYYFYEPQSVIPGSAKDSYDHLYMQALNQELLLNIISEKQLNVKNEQAWDILNEQTEAMIAKLSSEGFEPQKSEIIALITYLQKIPSSKKKKELDSLAQIDKMNKEKMWETILLDSASILFTAEDNEINISNGRKIFQANCSPCHFDGRRELIGPNLSDDTWRNGETKFDIARTIVHGVPRKGMVPWMHKLNPEEVSHLLVFINSLKSIN